MKTRLALILTLAALTSAPLCARDRQPGDFAPRTSLVYARIDNLGGAFTKMLGEDFEAAVTRLLATAPQNDYARGGGPLIAEILHFARHARKAEIALADVMIRAPYAQVVMVIDLAEQAPKEFSKEFLDLVKSAGKAMDGFKVTPTSVTTDTLCIQIFPGMMAVTTTPALMKHVEDVRSGNIEESLSSTKRFKGWADKATGELVMFADMRAFRSAVDRLGRDAAQRQLQVVEALEWHRWDYLSINGELPGRADSQLNLNAQLILSEPWGSLSFVMKPAGSFSLHRRLPKETLMMALAQLGNDHKKTLFDALAFFHDNEIGRAAKQAEQEIERCKRRIDELDKKLADLKEEAKDERAALEADKKQMQAQLDAAQKRMEDGRPRPFDPSKESRLAAGITEVTRPERFLDGMLEGLKAMDLDLEKLLAPFGSEIAVGNMSLPGSSLNGSDSNATMFMVVQTRTDVTELKDKILGFLQKTTDQQRGPDHIQRQWWVTRHVQGGDIIVQRGGWQNPCVFIGDGIVGYTGCEDCAVRILAASTGNGALPHGRVSAAENPGSKVFYMDLMEVLAQTTEKRGYGGEQPLTVPGFNLNVRKLLRSGLRLTIATDEQSQSLGLRASIAGDLNLRQMLDEISAEAEYDRARRHDETVLAEVRRGCEAWLQAVRPKLTQMKPDELKTTLAAVTFESLEKDGYLESFDGLRSAFDPLLAARFKEMLAKRALELGSGPQDKPELPLAEAGYAWFGVPPDIATQDLDQPEGRFPGKDGFPKDGKEKQMVRRSPAGPGDSRYGIQYNVWMVCAQHGSWTRGGRLALLHSGGAYQVAYLSDDQFNAIRAANTRNLRLDEVPTPAAAAQAEWRTRIKLNQSVSGACGIADRVLELKKNGDIKSYSEVAFRGADHSEDADKALTALLKAGERERYYGGFDSKDIEIIPADEGFRVRINSGGMWIEVGSDNTLKTSWDEG